jgi:hypothetical protein
MISRFDKRCSIDDSGDARQTIFYGDNWAEDQLATAWLKGTACRWDPKNRLKIDCVADQNLTTFEF